MQNDIIMEDVTLRWGDKIVLFHFAKRFWMTFLGENECVSEMIHQGFRKPS